MGKKNVGTQIKQVIIATRITLPMLEKLNDYLKLNAYVSTSDYLRDLVRKDLKEKGYKLYKGPNADEPNKSDNVGMEVNK